MAELLNNFMAFALTTFVGVFFFAVLPGLALMLGGFLIGLVASLPILAVASLTRLVGTGRRR